MVTTWKSRGFYRTVSRVFVEAMALDSTSGVSLSRAVHIGLEHIRNKVNSRPP
jgi:hypothetical protein